MLNTLSPTTKSLKYTNLRRGDIVNARGQIGVVYDVLKSADTDTVFILMSFVHNIGNSRQYDILEFTPQRARVYGADMWEYATVEQLEEALDNRRRALDKALGDVMDVASRAEGVVA